jgi:DNA modification methylase
MLSIADREGQGSSTVGDRTADVTRFDDDGGMATHTQQSAIHVTSDVHAGIAAVPDHSVGCLVTSPPYWARRRYTDRDDEIGIGDFDRYIEDLVGVFNAAERTLRPDATAWVNLGDTAANTGGSGGDYRAGGAYADRRRYRQGRAPVRGSQWALIPWRFAQALQDSNWLLRHTLVWDKGFCRPEDLNHVRRSGESHEHVFMFTRSMKYHFDPSELAERGSVWHIPVSRGRRGHAAPMPVELPRRCIAVSAPGLVLDPFSGSGTTLEAALMCRRSSIGVDFDPGAAEAARTRLGDALTVTDADGLAKMMGAATVVGAA